MQPGIVRAPHRLGTHWAHTRVQACITMASGGRAEWWVGRSRAASVSCSGGIGWAAELTQDELAERAGDELGVWIAGAVDHFWLHRNFLSEGSDWLDRLLALRGPAAASADGQRHSTVPSAWLTVRKLEVIKTTAALYAL